MTPEELAKFWSEWTNDNAPIGEGVYRLAAKDFLAKYDVMPKPAEVTDPAPRSKDFL